MSQQTALEFFSQVEQNPILKQKIQTVASQEELFKIAREAGYIFTANDMKAISESFESGELNEEELETVTGGGIKQIAHEVVDTETIICL